MTGFKLSDQARTKLKGRFPNRVSPCVGLKLSDGSRDEPHSSNSRRHDTDESDTVASPISVTDHVEPRNHSSESKFGYGQINEFVRSEGSIA